MACEFINKSQNVVVKRWYFNKPRRTISSIKKVTGINLLIKLQWNKPQNELFNILKIEQNEILGYKNDYILALLKEYNQRKRKMEHNNPIVSFLFQVSNANGTKMMLSNDLYTNEKCKHSLKTSLLAKIY